MPDPVTPKKRGAKNKGLHEGVSTWVEKPVYDRLRAIAAHHNVTMAKVVRAAIYRFLTH